MLILYDFFCKKIFFLTESFRTNQRSFAENCLNFDKNCQNLI